MEWTRQTPQSCRASSLRGWCVLTQRADRSHPLSWLRWAEVRNSYCFLQAFQVLQLACLLQ